MIDSCLDLKADSHFIPGLHSTCVILSNTTSTLVFFCVYSGYISFVLLGLVDAATSPRRLIDTTISLAISPKGQLIHRPFTEAMPNMGLTTAQRSGRRDAWTVHMSNAEANDAMMARLEQGYSSSSRPPSPPESGSTTPRLTIAPCPPRLQPYVPPPNYGTVDIHKTYRSSFPQDRHMDFMISMKIRSVL